MRIVVCAKQIPDPTTSYQFEAVTNWLIRPEDQLVDDTDRYGIEAGVQIAEANQGSVTLVSMGPYGNGQGLRQGLAQGADKAILIEDASLRGSDALTTARVLTAAIQREDFDLVIGGPESTDGSSGVVPQMIAEILGLPALTYVTKLDVGQGSVTVRRQTRAGYETVTCALPVLVTVTAGVAEPRYPTYRAIIAAKTKPVERLSLTDLQISKSPPQTVVSLAPAPGRTAGRQVEDRGEAHLEIIGLLKRLRMI